MTFPIRISVSVTPCSRARCEIALSDIRATRMASSVRPNARILKSPPVLRLDYCRNIFGQHNCPKVRLCVRSIHLLGWLLSPDRPWRYSSLDQHVEIGRGGVAGSLLGR